MPKGMNITETFRDAIAEHVPADGQTPLGDQGVNVLKEVTNQIADTTPLTRFEAGFIGHQVVYDLGMQARENRIRQFADTVEPEDIIGGGY